MTHLVEVGDEAPNFDLTSTEGAVLMLRDEIPRSPVLLFFFPEAAAASSDLVELAAMAAELAKREVKVLGISESPLSDLATIQREHSLPFPLLHDDRGFSHRYCGAESGGRTVALVDRRQRVAWLERDPESLSGVLTGVLGVAEKMPSSTANYPRSVINRLVDRWVN
jgi:peroxiredoxin